MPKYLSGGHQTTINSTVTELFPALAFNSNKRITSPDAMHKFIFSLVDNKKLDNQFYTVLGYANNYQEAFKKLKNFKESEI